MSRVTGHLIVASDNRVNRAVRNGDTVMGILEFGLMKAMIYGAISALIFLDLWSEPLF
jgi:hypothetical protein